MSVEWWYVEGSERVGPKSEEEIKALIQTSKIGDENFLWKRGFDNWKKLKEIDELKTVTVAPQIIEETPLPSPIEEAPKKEINWNAIDENEKIFMIKIGLDRGATSETEYGPFSIKNLKRLYDEKRITDKTFIYTKGLSTWIFLAELPFYERLFSKMPPPIDEQDRRKNIRRPFVARLFFHDQSRIYEGVCRDISVGGMQILVAGFPGKRGDIIAMNVHPNNTDFNFSAKGTIVRELEGGAGFSIRFNALDSSAERAILEFVAEN